VFAQFHQPHALAQSQPPQLAANRVLHQTVTDGVRRHIKIVFLSLPPAAHFFPLGKADAFRFFTVKHILSKIKS
jgi:hypothetical protein